MLQERIFWISPLWPGRLGCFPIKWLIYFLCGRIMLGALKSLDRSFPPIRRWFQAQVSVMIRGQISTSDIMLRRGTVGLNDHALMYVPYELRNRKLPTQTWLALSWVCMIDSKSMDTKYIKLHKRIKWKSQYMWEVDILIFKNCLL